jgi:signal transduction histidine kinase
MQAEKLYYRLVCLSVIMCHLFAGVQFWLKRTELEAPPRWIGQFYFLLVFSLCLSLLLFLYRKTEIAGTVYYVVKLIIFLVIGYAQGGYIGAELTLLIALIIENSAYFQLIHSILITLGITVLTLVSQQPVEAWDVTLSQVSHHDLFSLAIYVSIMSAFANGLHILVKRLDHKTQAADRLDKAVSQLVNANMGFQEYAITASKKSADHERKRLTRDIHDTAVHVFLNIMILTETAVDLLTPESFKLFSTLQQVISQAKEGVRDTRQALGEMRAIEEAVPKGLKAIHQLVKVFEEVTEVQVAIDFGNLPWSFDKELDYVLYRMIQEGLTNAFRHGNATMVHVRLWIFQTELIVRIHDNGKGASSIKKGIGLQGMEERIRKFQGRLEAKNVVDGFVVTAWIPLGENEGRTL